MDPRLLPCALADLPRYTSYPTAVQFASDFPAATANRWLSELTPQTTLSVYIHIPFCQQLCWYCGCHTSVPNSYDRAARYVELLCSDIARASRLAGSGRGQLRHLHFGGGTPTYLDDLHIGEILEAVDKGFGLAGDAEVALESDPRTLTSVRARMLAGMGFNRISFGVQDFDFGVQRKINRLQPFSLVAEATEYLRAAGFASINFDLMYGLPGQSVASVTRTAKEAASLAPDRLAVFGYAHVPWFKKHQKMIADSDLPGVAARYDQARAIAAELAGAGYVDIGLDHFARADDSLAIAARSGTLRRNFQGYTTDVAGALLSFGASAISEFPRGFVQAARDTLSWSEQVSSDRNPASRGLHCTPEDRMRAEIIERLMCDLAVDYAAIAAAHGFPDTVFAGIHERLAACREAGIAELGEGSVRVPEDSRLFLRSVAAAFDAHYVAAPNRHAKAV